MLRSITAQQLQEWMVFAELEPFDPEREDQLFASVVQVIANVHRGRNTPAYKLEDARLFFGDAVRVRVQKRDWRVMKMLAQTMTASAKETYGSQHR
jgi:hypothetical protein